ncbi:MAG: DUF3006 domain-containing protein [Ruminococcus sp.]|jgi:hypothetical protein|nr:DUF3006 domain-containing protein [Ruminococcus sp.]
MIIIERIENDKVVVEISTASGFHNQMTIDRSEFDGEIREGDVLTLDYGHYKTDENATKIRRADLTAKQEIIIDKSLRKKKTADEIL